MDDNQDMSGNDTENVIADEVDESLGGPKEAIDENESQESEGHSKKGDPLYVQKRLKQQRRAHEREIREMQSRIDQMQSQMQPAQNFQQEQSPYGAGMGANQMGMNQMGSNQMGGGQNPGNVNDMIQQAVGYALQQKEMKEREARESEAQQHIVKQYQELNKHLDSTSDKYDDFDDLVRGNAPFTAAMRDIALTLPKKGPGSAGEVLYRLGKNPEELSRIAKLHPVDQAAELIALSHALISGGEQRQQQSRPLGNIKSNPVVNSVGINEKTPVSDIRSRMKAGTFK